MDINGDKWIMLLGAPLVRLDASWKISGIERPWGINRELVMRDPEKKNTGNRYSIPKNMLRVIGAFMSC